MGSERQAVLVFANVASLDCARKGWPRAFKELLVCHDLSAWVNLGFDVHLFSSFECARPPALPFPVHQQQGSSFAQRLEKALDSLTDLGYCKIVVIGSDCPDLTLSDIQEAFTSLKKHALVLGPDHRGGCYLIGLDAHDRFRLRGIQWQRNTDCAELSHRFGLQNCWRLAVKIDLDTWSDLRLLSRSSSLWSGLAKRLLDAFKTPQLSTTQNIRLCENEQKIRWQLPPPRKDLPFLCRAA